MLQYSKQHKIVNDISLSFSKLEKIHTKIQDKILIRDKQFYNTKKYENFTEGNFKFLVLWTVFKNNTNKIDTLKLISSYTPDDIKDIHKRKERLVLHNNTFDNDAKVMQVKTVSHKLVLDLYRKQEISMFYVYWYFYNNPIQLTRIEKKKIDRINFFLDFFPSIKSSLNLIKD